MILSAVICPPLILDKHLVKRSNIPRPILCIQCQIGLRHITLLQSPGFYSAVCDASLQMIGTSFDSKIGKTNFEGIARSYRRATCKMSIGHKQQLKDRKV